MIRMPKSCSTRPLLAIGVLLIAVATSLPGVVYAGDQDGLGGYSMRLKQKYFDGSDSGSGGPGQVIYTGTEPSGKSSSPELLSTTLSDRRWLLSLNSYYELFVFWFR